MAMLFALFRDNPCTDIAKLIRPDGKIRGLAAVYGTADMYGDVIVRGAFAQAVAARAGDVRMLARHDPDAVIGHWDRVTCGSQGLRVEGVLDEAVMADWLQQLAQAGGKIGLSIGFRTLKRHFKDGRRYLTKIELWEVSLVAFPAHPDAGLQVWP